MAEDRELLKTVFAPAPDCPSLDELVSADPAQANLAAECPRCIGEVALYQEFIQEVPAGEVDEKILRRLHSRLPTAEAPRSNSWKTWLESLWRPAVYGPAAVAFAGLLVMVGLSLRPADPIDGSAPSGSVERGLSMELLSPKGEVVTAPATRSEERRVGKECA